MFRIFSNNLFKKLVDLVMNINRFFINNKKCPPRKEGHYLRAKNEFI